MDTGYLMQAVLVTIYHWVGNTSNGNRRKVNPILSDKFEPLVTPKLLVKPITLKLANKFVTEHHRHHGTVVGYKFAIGCYTNDNLLGIAIVGRPISRRLDNGLTAEVTRLCTNGTKNVASKLYSACWRIAKEMGYKKIITYILASETGISLKASGWECEDEKCGGLAWNSGKGIVRTDIVTDLFGTKKKYPNEYKRRYIKQLSRDCTKI